MQWNSVVEPGFVSRNSPVVVGQFEVGAALVAAPTCYSTSSPFAFGGMSMAECTRSKRKVYAANRKVWVFIRRSSVTILFAGC